MEGSNLVKENISTLRRGIDIERDIYKKARHLGDLEAMCSAIENIKGEIKLKALASKSNSSNLAYVEKVINWYRNLNSRFKRKTPNGYVVRLPSNIDDISMRNLHIAYEKLINILESMDLV